MQGTAYVLGAEQSAERRRYLVGLLAEYRIQWCRPPRRKGDAGDALDEVRALVGEHPERKGRSLLVVDFSTLEVNGLDKLRTLIRHDAPDLICVGLSPSPEDCLRAIATGARGFLVTGEPIADQRRHLQSTVRGEVSLSASCAQILRDQIERLRLIPEYYSAKLSPREYEFLQMLSAGLTVPESANVAGVSYHTASTYVRRIYQKLGVRSRLELIRLVNSAASIARDQGARTDRKATRGDSARRKA